METATSRPPVITKFIEQPRAEHDITILLALALTDMDEHPSAIDMFDLQPN